jgi:hypothetical protein
VKCCCQLYVDQSTPNAAMLTTSLHVYLHVAAVAARVAAAITADVLTVCARLLSYLKDLR